MESSASDSREVGSDALRSTWKCHFRSYLRLNEEKLDFFFLVFKRHCTTHTSMCIDYLIHSFIQLLLYIYCVSVVDRQL